MTEHEKEKDEPPPPPKKRKKKRPPSEAGAGNARKNRAMKPRQATLDGTKEHDD